MRAFLVAVFLSVLVGASAQDDIGLDRMTRTAPGHAWLVPYPRVGKRSNPQQESSLFSAQKRLYLARVGKRAYMYAARVGK